MINSAWRDRSSKDTPSNPASTDCIVAKGVFDTLRQADITNIITKIAISFEQFFIKGLVKPASNFPTISVYVKTCETCPN